MDTSDIYNNITTTIQEMYDSFNTLVFSLDTKVLHKILTLTTF
jgi:hypothetical protein